MNLRKRIIKWGESGFGNFAALAKASGSSRTSLHQWLHRVPKQDEMWDRVEEAFHEMEHNQNADPEKIRMEKITKLSAERIRIDNEIKALTCEKGEALE